MESCTRSNKMDFLRSPLSTGLTILCTDLWLIQLSHTSHWIYPTSLPILPLDLLNFHPSSRFSLAISWIPYWHLCLSLSNLSNTSLELPKTFDATLMPTEYRLNSHVLCNNVSVNNGPWATYRMVILQDYNPVFLLYLFCSDTQIPCVTTAYVIQYSNMF